ncbi:GTP cyclohydrolase FolE2 [Gilvimarinus polysaccharolyticus]|uniref:GTP cyclohydrolase FolE2 n=1 Tax=Gilvimarinus polysaccharolyticus TaxID=863921 RepID=UPI0009FDBAA5|nr:GTP cyclohydrolase FolE2 [Gilvimarinus polysaccharolyticus]
MNIATALPDIAKSRTKAASGCLQWVGMEGIAVPLTLDSGTSQQQTIAAKANVYVSLDDPAEKGIHMSRLYALLNQLSSKSCDKAGLDSLLQNMVTSQTGISQNAKFDVCFDYLMTKDSLLSNETGFQSYQIEIGGQIVNGKYDYRLKVTVPYSSTCPCSAALARQLLADAIDTQFDTVNISKQTLLDWAKKTSIATPHSQRSYVYLDLSLGDNAWPSLTSLLLQFEDALGTPVQTMVKRRDEQEFARLNAENLMFCEDAARKIKTLLEHSNWIEDYWFKVEHQESLHAHNAVVIDSKFHNINEVTATL